MSSVVIEQHLRENNKIITAQWLGDEDPTIGIPVDTYDDLNICLTKSSIDTYVSSSNAFLSDTYTDANGTKTLSDYSDLQLLPEFFVARSIDCHISTEDFSSDDRVYLYYYEPYATSYSYLCVDKSTYDATITPDRRSNYGSYAIQILKSVTAPSDAEYSVEIFTKGWGQGITTSVATYTINPSTGVEFTYDLLWTLVNKDMDDVYDLYFVITRTNPSTTTTVSVTFNPNNGSSSYVKIFNSGDTFGTAVNSVSKSSSKSTLNTITFDYSNTSCSGTTSLSSYQTTTYTFNAWYYGSTKITSTTTVDAYDGKIITANFSTSITTQNTIILPEPDLMPTGYTFVGWYGSKSSFETCYGKAGASYTVTSSLTMYAKYLRSVIPILPDVDNTAWISYSGTEVDGDTGKLCINEAGSSDIGNNFTATTTVTIPSGYGATFYLKAYSEASWDGVIVTDSYNSSTSFYNTDSKYKASGNGGTNEVKFASSTTARTITIVFKTDNSTSSNGNKGFVGYTLTGTTTLAVPIENVFKFIWVSNSSYKITNKSGYTFTGTLEIQNSAGTKYWSMTSDNLAANTSQIATLSSSLSYSAAYLFADGYLITSGSPTVNGTLSPSLADVAEVEK